jgi:two-component system, OmpR family, sensor histidine kinase MprB
VSFRTRLALLCAAAVVLTAVGGSVAVYFIVRHELRADVVNGLRRTAAVHTAGGFVPLGAGGGGRQGAISTRPPYLPRFISASGAVLAARYPQLDYPVSAEARTVAAGGDGSKLEVVRLGSERLEVLTVPAGRRRAFQVAESLSSLDSTLHRLEIALLIVGGIGIVLSPLAGLAVAGGALVPVRRLTRAAARVARTGEVDYRIDERGRDEFASLAATFNAMLARLGTMVETVERTRRAQRQLVADVSHELRTPLSTLRANLELLSLGERDAVFADMLAGVNELTGLVGQLIELAREEAREPEQTPVRLDEVVEEALSSARQHYPELTFTATLAPTTVSGSREALARAVANLLDNAGKWSPAEGTVEVALEGGALSVRDHGPGIAEDDLPQVFERFYRGDGRGRPGSGLGLAIVAQVMAAHGGQVEAERPPGGGALLCARFPTA